MEGQVRTRKAPQKRREIGVRELVRNIQNATAADDAETAHREALKACGRYLSGSPEVQAALAQHFRVFRG